LSATAQIDLFCPGGGHFSLELLHRTVAQSYQPSGLNDARALGQLDAGLRNLLGFRTGTAKVSADDAGLPGDELAVAGGSYP